MGNIITSTSEVVAKAGAKIIKPGEEFVTFADKVVRSRPIQTVEEMTAAKGAHEMKRAGGFQTEAQVGAREMREALDSNTMMTRAHGGSLDTPSNSLQGGSITHHRITEPALVDINTNTR